MTYGPDCTCAHAQSHHNVRTQKCMMPDCGCESFQNKGGTKNKLMKEINEIGHLIVIRNLKEIIQSLKRGSCWCEVAVGNPMVRGHSKGCIKASGVKT